MRRKTQEERRKQPKPTDLIMYIGLERSPLFEAAPVLDTQQRNCADIMNVVFIQSVQYRSKPGAFTSHVECVLLMHPVALSFK
jgi:hypothetical protein